MITQMMASIILGIACTNDHKSAGLDTSQEDLSDNNDADGDGFTLEDDCDDTNALIHPMAEEVCDGRDNDCNDEIDEGEICPCEFRSFDGLGYLFCEENVVWAQAMDACPNIMDGYSLLSINDESENVWVYEQLVEINNEQRWWISLNDQQEEGVFVWGNGQTPKYENWERNEPNDSGGEDCTELNRFFNEFWNDIRCNAELYYVCKGPR